MKIAIFKNIEYGFQSTYEVEQMEGNEEYVQISEELEVEFVMISDADLVNKEVNLLKELKKKEQAKCEIKIQSIDTKIGNLLAITDESK